MFLTADDLRDLTGKVRPSAQAAELRAMGIEYWVNSAGRPVVNMTTLLAELGPPKDQASRPGFNIPQAWNRYLTELDTKLMQERLVIASDQDLARPCIYFHVLGGDLQYVGQTVDHCWRQASHRRSGRIWDNEYAIPMPEWWLYGARHHWLNAVEAAMIDFFEPPYNIKRPRCWGRSAPLIAHMKKTGFKVPA